MPVIWDPFLQAIDAWAQAYQHPANLPQANVAQNTAAGESAGSQGSVNNLGNVNDQAPSNVNAAPAITGSTEFLPYCGQACYGPTNSCDPSTGCSCIADALQGGSNNFFTGKCGILYSSTAIRGRRLSSMDLEVMSRNQSLDSPISQRVLGAVIGAAAAPDLTNTACPCNCTYVSHGCCASVDGMVQEAPSMRLGALKMPNGGTCKAVSGKAGNATIPH